ncbi:MAG: discoidin domain-containing protein [Mediterranea sp.]|jgi:hypothetical protein|nr:discoidin domain-containing protein [Mediterranea sp.]
MKKTIITIACTGLLTLGLTGCDDKESIVPAPVANLHYDTTPGRIVLRWDTIVDANTRYVQVDFYNPLTRKDERRLASVYADSIEIPDTRQKYGEYNFLVKTVSPTNDYSVVETITAQSEPAIQTWIPTSVKLTAEMLSTNAQEPSEGPIANLLDDNTSTFFHTKWSSPVPALPHYMTVALPVTINSWWSIYYAPRNNANNKPTDFDLLGSTDGTTWFPIKNFTQEADGLPVDRTTAYTSERMNASDKPFSYLRYSVNKTNNNTTFWTMSEFKIYTWILIDPEAPDED